MYNSIDSVQAILNEYQKNLSVEHSLKRHGTYHAHTPPKGSNKKVETLAEHLNLVNHYFLELVNAHQLDQVIDRMVLDYFMEIKIDSQPIAQYLKQLFVHSICYHDHGKINENFQASPIKMNNPNFKGMENQKNGIGTQHSTLSSYIFLCHKIEEASNLFCGSELNLAISLALLFSYGIYKHHGKYFHDDYLNKIIIENQLVQELRPYLEKFNVVCQVDRINDSLLKLDTILPKISFNYYAKSFALYQLLRLNFSLLTASDYLATNEYMNNSKTDDFGLLSRERIEEIYDKVTKEEWLDAEKSKPNFNKRTYIEINTLSLEKPMAKSNSNLNLLRQQMATEAVRNVRKNPNENIFYLEAPTGGGKTNISMLVALELLKSNPELNKVFYVFPFTTLIDQTYKSVQQHLGLKENEIIALHSKSSFLKDDTGDGSYGKEHKNYIDHLFVHYPFCLLSHIRFFEILKTNEKERNYNLHRLANSVVVIDELQTYDPEHWDKIIYFIQQYAKYYNIKFIVMSATLPKISKLNVSLDTKNIVDLLSNARMDYFQNMNFKDRVSFDFSLAENKIELDALVKMVLEESKLYANIDGGKSKPVNSVYTIIEFIFKKTATQFFQIIETQHAGFFDEIFVLSGTILEHRRKHIVNFLKCKENRLKRVLLITTQVVEAGVDIDMDLGFKDKSLLDSDEQLAGRINRNVNKEGCKLFLFDYNKEAIIYGKDLRYEMTKKELRLSDQKMILENKDFDCLYDKVIEFKNKRNQDTNFVGFEEYKNHLNALRFKSVSDEFKLIKQENISCYIPLNIPIEIQGEESGILEKIFSKQDLDFLAKNRIVPSEKRKISGREVFDLYISLINADVSFHERNIRVKQLQPILSKYVFSIFKTCAIETQLKRFFDEPKSQYGYFYMEYYNDFYNENYGMDDTLFNSNETQFL